MNENLIANTNFRIGIINCHRGKINRKTRYKSTRGETAQKVIM